MITEHYHVVILINKSRNNLEKISSAFTGSMLSLN